MRGQDIMSKKELNRMSRRWNISKEELDRVVERVKKNRPEIESRREFKKSLEEQLMLKAEEMKDKKSKKVLPFPKIPKYMGIGAAAILVVVIGLPNLSKINKGRELEVLPVIDTLEYSESLDEIALVKESVVLEEEIPEMIKAPMVSRTAKKKEFGLKGDSFFGGFVDSRQPLDSSFNTEEYTKIDENPFFTAIDTPLSTFSVDVDTASYANVRRFINQGTLPPKDAVRIEEMVNYFNYDYPLPKGDTPFSINTEVSEAPWNRENLLVHIGLQGRDIPKRKLPSSNLVFLIDVSGSMDSENKLGLLVKSVELMLKEFTRKDRISIVAYAGAAGVVLPSTSGNKTEVILEAFERLSAGGSTAGAQGIELAYEIAMDNFIPDGNNRVIIATDGDFNVGVSSSGDLTRLIEEKRDSGVFLTVLGFGMGNYKDSRMESLANSGNGNYAYIDSLLEAQKVLVHDIRKTLFVIAKDVKIQVEFNPASVKQYRLIGYETRLLKDRDFNDDKIDAGEIGSGHTVTALYEVVPFKEGETEKASLRYQDKKINSVGETSGELLALALRYKEPNGDKSKLKEVRVLNEVTELGRSSNNFKFSAAVAGYGQILRESEFIGDFSYDDVINLTKESIGDDEYGYRSEFYTLLRKAKLLK